MANHLGSVSAKILKVVENTKKGDLSKALLDNLKGKRKDLEAERQELMSLASRKKIRVGLVKSALVTAAGDIKATLELLRMSKVFKIQDK